MCKVCPKASWFGSKEAEIHAVGDFFHKEGDDLLTSWPQQSEIHEVIADDIDIAWFVREDQVKQSSVFCSFWNRIVPMPIAFLMDHVRIEAIIYDSSNLTSDPDLQL